MQTVVAASILVVGLGVVTYLQWRRTRALRRRRDGFFHAVRGLFDAAEVTPNRIGYPVLTGYYRGSPIKLEVIVDSLAMRRLPVLWLSVTHYCPLRMDAPLEALAHPDGSEVLFTNGHYGWRFDTPDGFPEHVRVATSEPTRAPPVEILWPLAAFLAAEKTKEVLVAARGVRVVRKLAEADLRRYRATRDTKFDVDLQAGDLEPVLAALDEIGQALSVSR